MISLVISFRFVSALFFQGRTYRSTNILVKKKGRRKERNEKRGRQKEKKKEGNKQERKRINREEKRKERERQIVNNSP
jgi:hypothetical protein